MLGSAKNGNAGVNSKSVVGRLQLPVREYRFPASRGSVQFGGYGVVRVNSDVSDVADVWLFQRCDLGIVLGNGDSQPIERRRHNMVAGQLSAYRNSRVADSAGQRDVA